MKVVGPESSFEVHFFLFHCYSGCEKKKTKGLNCVPSVGGCNNECQLPVFSNFQVECEVRLAWYCGAYFSKVYLKTLQGEHVT